MKTTDLPGAAHQGLTDNKHTIRIIIPTMTIIIPKNTQNTPKRYDSWQGWSMYRRNNFGVPTVCPTAPTSPSKVTSNQIKFIFMALIVGLVGAVGHTVGAQKSLLCYIDHPCYPI